MQLPSMGLVLAQSTEECHRSGAQNFLNGCTMAHKGCFLQSRYPVYAEFLILMIYTITEILDIGTHPGMPINITAAISGTEFLDESAASDLMVTFAFTAALG